jgi:hypothetical protein
MRVSCRWTGHHLRIGVMPSGMKYQGTLIIAAVLGIVLLASFFATIGWSLRLWIFLPWLITLWLLSLWPNHLRYDRYTGEIEFWPGIWKNQLVKGRIGGAAEVHLISADGKFDGNNSRKRQYRILIVSSAAPIKLPVVYCFEHEAWNLADGIARAFGISMRHASADQIVK